MSEILTRADIEDVVTAGVDRLEKRFDHRFDRFEGHFDDTMTAIRATLDETYDAVKEERRREISRVQHALLELARSTGHLDEVARLLQA